jgi:hypothetical protein
MELRQPGGRQISMPRTLTREAPTHPDPHFCRAGRLFLGQIRGRRAPVGHRPSLPYQGGIDVGAVGTCQPADGHDPVGVVRCLGVAMDSLALNDSSQAKCSILAAGLFFAGGFGKLGGFRRVDDEKIDLRAGDFNCIAVNDSAVSNYCARSGCWTALADAWDDETAAIFSAITAFWFGNRAMSKARAYQMEKRK